MPTVRGKRFPYTPEGRASAAKARRKQASSGSANDARKQGMSRAAEASGGRSTTRGKSGSRSLPSQANSMAKNRAMGKRGMEKRKRKS